MTNLGDFWAEGIPLVMQAAVDLRGLIERHLPDLHAYWTQHKVEIISIVPKGCMTMFTQWWVVIDIELTLSIARCGSVIGVVV